ncbi:MAG: hypothetical protein O2877_01625 [bacterium]|nr:hypothetical protein [bacterium]
MASRVKRSVIVLVDLPNLLPENDPAFSSRTLLRTLKGVRKAAMARGCVLRIIIFLDWKVYQHILTDGVRSYIHQNDMALTDCPVMRKGTGAEESVDRMLIETIQHYLELDTRHLLFMIASSDSGYTRDRERIRSRGHDIEIINDKLISSSHLGRGSDHESTLVLDGDDETGQRLRTALERFANKNGEYLAGLVQGFPAHEWQRGQQFENIKLWILLTGRLIRLGHGASFDNLQRMLYEEAAAYGISLGTTPSAEQKRTHFIILRAISSGWFTRRVERGDISVNLNHEFAKIVSNPWLPAMDAAEDGVDDNDAADDDQEEDITPEPPSRLETLVSTTKPVIKARLQSIDANSSERREPRLAHHLRRHYGRTATSSEISEILEALLSTGFLVTRTFKGRYLYYLPSELEANRAPVPSAVNG